MSAASQAKRARGDALEVVALERGTHTSYSACGIPYWVAGDVPARRGPHRAYARAAPGQRHRRPAAGARRPRSTSTAGEVEVARPRAARRPLGFDHLVIATGAEPAAPTCPASTPPGSTACRRWTTASGCSTRSPARPRRAVVVGGGYIGIEMAEAMVRRGLRVTVLDRCARADGDPRPGHGRGWSRPRWRPMDIDVRHRRDGDGLRGRPRRPRAGGASPTTAPFETDLVVLGRRRARRRRRWPPAPACPSGSRGLLTDDCDAGVSTSSGRLGGRRLRRVAPPGVRTAGCTSRSARTRTSRAGCVGTNLAGGYADVPGRGRHGDDQGRATWRSPAPGCGSRRPPTPGSRRSR